MRTKHFSILLAILLVTVFIVPIVAAASKPVGVNPVFPNPPVGLIWGTNLRLENATNAAQSWFGVGAAGSSIQGIDPPVGYLVDIRVGGTAYSKYTIASLGQTAPGGGKEDNWRLRLRAFGEADSTATISSVMENDTTLFVPQDYSVVLDNSAAGIFANLREENGYITGLDIGPKYVTLYVDNAVNIQSVTTGDPLTGPAGDPLTLSVTVKNTGRYTDIYSVSANAGSVSTGALAAGSSATKSVPATYPSGTRAILVTTAGSYAKDEDSSLVLTGVQPIVFRAYNTGYASDTALGIAPWENYYLNDNAPIMVAKKIGAGAVVASSWNGGTAYYRSASYPSADNMDVLFDITFQWMVPGATKILWYDGDNVYTGYRTWNTTTKKMLDNLRVKNGYTIDNGNMLRLDNLGLYTTYNILVLNQEQNGTAAQGGNPSSLLDNELDAIRTWVNGGKGVIVQEVSDYLNYCYNRVSNRILDNLGFGWWFQHDTINDATRNDLAASYKPLVVRVVGNEIGDNYAAQTGRENILAYKCPTLVPRPTIAATVDVPHGENDENTTVTVQVTITNTGSVWDNFSLSASDNEGWTLSLSTTSMGILNPSDNAIVNLTVTIPPGTAGQIDNVTVTAKSFNDGSNFSGSGTVTSIVRGVSVSISPSYENGPNGATLTYTVTAANTGNVSDNYSLMVSDNDNWGPTVSPTSLIVPAGENRTATLSVTVPDNAINFSEDNMTVTATSQTDNTVTAENSCIAQVTTFRGVSVSISPTSQSGANGATLTYTVTVNNTGNISDNYSFAVTDSAGWSPSVSPSPLTVSPGSGTATLSVTIPSNAIVGTSDTITVTATSRTDNIVNASDSCTAQATAPALPPAAGVTMSISPSSQSGTPGTTLVYTMSITNTGGATDTFDLRFSGGAGWSPSISPNSLTLAAGTPGGATLTVTVPSWAAAGASTTITVTATSRADPSVSNSASCSATASGLPAGPGVTPTPTEATWPAILAIAAAIMIIILSLSFILL